MYIVSIKKGTAPKEYNLIDELFGTPINTSKYIRTQVSEYNSYIDQPRNYWANLTYNTTRMLDFLDTHKVEEMYKKNRWFQNY